MKKVFILSLLFILLATTGQSCQLNFNKKKKNILADAGVFKSTDNGVSWKQVVGVPTISGKPESIGAISVLTMEVDPQDNNTIYLGTKNHGIYFTYDGGITWQQRLSFTKGMVHSIKIDPSSKCIIYASLFNTVKKTTDCARTWETVFIDNNTKTEVVALAVDHYNPKIIYVGTSNGIVNKSFDYGRTWSTPFSKIKGKIVKFMLDPKDSRIIYLPTVSSGIFKSTDAGVNWISLNNNLKEFNGYTDYKQLIFNPSKNNSLILASKYGLLKTEDGGFNWTPIQLLTEPGKTNINTVAVDPSDDNIIYYTTNNIFYKTINSGSDWETKKIFSTKISSNFIINSKNKEIMYMSFFYP